MVICDHDCARCKYPDCLCEELTAEEIRRSDELDNAILRSRGEFGRGGRHPQPRVEQESGATVRQWRERNGLSLESAAFVIGVGAWTMRYIESGGPVPEEEWKKDARYVDEHCEVDAEEVYTPQVLARQLQLPTVLLFPKVLLISLTMTVILICSMRPLTALLPSTARPQRSVIRIRSLPNWTAPMLKCSITESTAVLCCGATI